MEHINPTKQYTGKSLYLSHSCIRGNTDGKDRESTVERV